MRPADADLLLDAARRATRYLAGLDERPVAPRQTERLAEFDEPLPSGPSDAVLTLSKLDDVGSPATMGSAGGRFFGFVIGGALPVALAANWLAGAWDQNSALFNVTPVPAQLEMVSLRWMRELLHLPSALAGAFVTGATMANFTALAAARHAVLKRAGWDVEADGLFGAPPICVVVGAEVHPTLLKALGMLGLGRNRVVRLPVDAQGRIRADALPALSGPCIVCLQAGNIHSGAFDPFVPLCEWAHAAGAWVHVDGAFGLWAAASAATAHLTVGMCEADSWAADAHKVLNIPYDCGVVMVRDEGALRCAMSVSASYLPTVSVHRNPADYAPELSRRGRGIEVWAALRSLGRSGVEALVDRLCRHTRRFAQALAAHGFEVLNEVVFNQCAVSVGNVQDTQRVVAAIVADGTCWVGSSSWQDRPCVRISVCSWATTDADVERSIEAIVRATALLHHTH